MPRRQDDVSWRPHDTDRSIDPFDDGLRSTRAPSSRPAVPPPSRPAASRGPAPARPPAGADRRVDLRTVLLAGGGVLAVVATVLVFLTDDPDLLRVAVVAAAWAFVLATFVAGRRRSEQADAAGREAALRRTYEQELEREVAARREYELELENDLRRETEDAMRAELDALREELAGVSELRREVARVAELREDVAGLTALRDEVARVAALRDDVLSLTALRAEIGQIGELRADLGRLRAEIVEQLSSEMLVERIVMRTQAGRLPTGEMTRLDAGPAWRDEAPRELTGGWPAVRLDEHAGTQQYERVRVERAAPPLPWEQADRAQAAPPPSPAPAAPPAQPLPTAAWPLPHVPAEPPAADPAPTPQDPHPPARPAAAPVTEAYGMSLPPRRSRHSADADADAVADAFAAPAGPAPTPVEWLAARSLLDTPTPDVAPTAERPRPSPRRRRNDDDLVPPPADELLTTERPVAGRTPGAGSPFVPPASAAPPPAPSGPAGQSRLEEILAESGVQPATGNRRRRRYREDDGSGDDVLARVLRGR